jgi:hypothetical protein
MQCGEEVEDETGFVQKHHGPDWVEIHVHSLPIAGEEKEGNALGSFKSPSRYKRIQVRLWITAQQEKL